MMNFFKGRTCEINSEDVLKEGWLSKESKYRKVWRERWCVLDGKCIATFEKERKYDSPTEVIDINKVKTIKSDDSDKTIFKVETSEGVFLFKSKSFDEKEQWIGAIGKVMITSSSKGLFIQEDE